MSLSKESIVSIFLIGLDDSTTKLNFVSIFHNNVTSVIPLNLSHHYMKTMQCFLRYVHVNENKLLDILLPQNCIAMLFSQYGIAMLFSQYCIAMLFSQYCIAILFSQYRNAMLLCQYCILIQFSQILHFDPILLIYCSLLDCSKALDQIKHGKLLEKLVAKDIPPVIIRLLMFMYINGKAKVKWNKEVSEYFNVSNGVR